MFDIPALKPAFINITWILRKWNWWLQSVPVPQYCVLPVRCVYSSVKVATYLNIIIPFEQALGKVYILYVNRNIYCLNSRYIKDKRMKLLYVRVYIYKVFYFCNACSASTWIWLGISPLLSLYSGSHVVRGWNLHHESAMMLNNKAYTSKKI